MTPTPGLSGRKATWGYTASLLDPWKAGLEGFCDGPIRKIGHEKAVFLKFLQNPRSDVDNLWLI